MLKPVELMSENYNKTYSASGTMVPEVFFFAKHIELEVRNLWFAEVLVIKDGTISFDEENIFWEENF